MIARLSASCSAAWDWLPAHLAIASAIAARSSRARFSVPAACSSDAAGLGARCRLVYWTTPIVEMTWPASNSHILTSDVWPGNNVTITIKPGGIVKFNVGVEFYCRYSQSSGLGADGKASLVRFTSKVPAPSRGDWVNLGFYDQTMAGASKFVNCTVEYGGGNDQGNVAKQNAWPTISGDSLGHSEIYGTWLAGGGYPDPATLRANNTFYDSPAGHIRGP